MVIVRRVALLESLMEIPLLIANFMELSRIRMQAALSGGANAIMEE